MCTFIQRNNKFMFDLYAAARIALIAHGVKSITGGEHCTYSEKEKYYSYRRDGEKSGRMAHLYLDYLTLTLLFRLTFFTKNHFFIRFI